MVEGYTDRDFLYIKETGVTGAQFKRYSTDPTAPRRAAAAAERREDDPGGGGTARGIGGDARRQRARVGALIKGSPKATP